MSKRKINKFASVLVQLKADLMKEGFILTAHAMEGPIKQIGWEEAEKIGREKELKQNKKR